MAQVKSELLILSGTNRPGARTKIVAERVLGLAQSALSSQPAIKPVLLDLANLKADLFATSSYAQRPAWFSEQFQSHIDAARGVLIVTPEYNGSFPGVLKYFIDMLEFPRSLSGSWIGFVGVSAGMFGALRSIEQLAEICLYRRAHIFGPRVHLPSIDKALQPDGSLVPDLDQRLKDFVSEFCVALLER